MGQTPVDDALDVIVIPDHIGRMIIAMKKNQICFWYTFVYRSEYSIPGIPGLIVHFIGPGWWRRWVSHWTRVGGMES